MYRVIYKCWNSFFLWLVYVAWRLVFNVNNVIFFHCSLLDLILLKGPPILGPSFNLVQVRNYKFWVILPLILYLLIPFLGLLLHCQCSLNSLGGFHSIGKIWYIKKMICLKKKKRENLILGHSLKDYKEYLLFCYIYLVVSLNTLLE